MAKSPIADYLKLINKKKRYFWIFTILIVGWIAFSFVNAIEDTTPGKFVWQSTDALRVVVCIVFGLITFAFSWLTTNQSKLLSDEVVKAKKAMLEMKLWSKVFQYTNSGQHQGSYEYMADMLEREGERQLYIANYTNTNFPEYYSRNLRDILYECLYAEGEISLTLVQQSSDDGLKILGEDPFLYTVLDWKRIGEHVESKNPEQVSGFPSKRIQSSVKARERFLKKYCVQILNVDKCEGSEENRDVQRERYLLLNTVWFWFETSKHKLNRMLYLPQDKKNTGAAVDRFLFACASIINNMFSARYSVGILPARLNSRYWDKIDDYHLVSSITDDSGRGIWVSSGLRPRNVSSAELPMGVMLKSEEHSGGDLIIACKCEHFTRFTKDLWEAVKSGGLVLFSDGKFNIKLFEVLRNSLYERLDEDKRSAFQIACNNFLDIFKDLKIPINNEWRIVGVDGKQIDPAKDGSSWKEVLLTTQTWQNTDVIEFAENIISSNTKAPHVENGI